MCYRPRGLDGGMLYYIHSSHLTDGIHPHPPGTTLWVRCTNKWGRGLIQHDLLNTVYPDNEMNPFMQLDQKFFFFICFLSIPNRRFIEERCHCWCHANFFSARFSANFTENTLNCDSSQQNVKWVYRHTTMVAQFASFPWSLRLLL